MSDVEVRREARRRKILENSESRLKRITSLEGKTTEGTHLKPRISNSEPQKKVLFKNPRLENEQVMRDVQQNPSIDVNTIFVNSVPEDTDSLPPEGEEFELLRNTSYINLRLWLIIILALLVRTMLMVYKHFSDFFPVDLYDLHLNKIFVPFLAYELIDFVFYMPPIQINSMMFSLLALSNLETRYVRIILSSLHICLRMIEDLMIYFFALVLLDQAFIFILGER